MAAPEEENQKDWYRVCLNTIVRKGQKLDSERLRILPMGSKVRVRKRVDRRVLIDKPLDGWCSLKSSNGDTILTKMAPDEAPETPSGSNLHEKAEREREHYQTLQTDMATQVQASGLNANDKHEIQELIIESDMEKLKSKIMSVESQLTEKKTAQRQYVEDLRHQIEEAEAANETCDELERIAQAKAQELKTIQAKMQLAINSQVRGVNEDGTRPLESGAVVQLGVGKLSVLGIVRYIGPVDGEDGAFIGLEMESGGDTNGTYEGKTYFEVASTDKGMFFPTSDLSKRIYADALLMQLVSQMNVLAQESTAQQ